MSIPFISIPNSQGQFLNIIRYNTAESSPWVSLVADTPNTVTIPPGADMVRFAQDFGVNVYSSPDAIVIPTAGATIFSRTETNAVLRDLTDLIKEGITALNLLTTADTTVQCHFYKIGAS